MRLLSLRTVVLVLVLLELFVVEDVEAWRRRRRRRRAVNGAWCGWSGCAYTYSITNGYQYYQTRSCCCPCSCCGGAGCSGSSTDYNCGTCYNSCNPPYGQNYYISRGCGPTYSTICTYCGSYYYYCDAYNQYGCPAGYYCVNGYYYICTGASYQPYTYQSSCYGLGGGYYGTPEGSGVAHTNYGYCTPGYYCPGDGNRYLCPNGQYQDSYYATGCKGVPAGYYAYNTRSVIGACGVGYYCPGSDQRTLISSGYYGTPQGNPSLYSSQAICPAGYYCPGSGYLYLCPNQLLGYVVGGDKYQPSQGQLSCISCSTCTTYYYQSSPCTRTANSVCSTCSQCLPGQTLMTGSCTLNVNSICKDTNPPTLTLSGANPMTVEAGSTYVEPGYTATDVKDGSRTASVVVSGWNKDTSVPGLKVLTYTVSDTDGNTVFQIRQVNVVDTTKPVITLTAPNPQTWQAGGTFCLSNTFVCPRAYTDPGYTATDYVTSSATLSSSMSISGTVNTLLVGTYVLTYNVRDTAGNPANTVTRSVQVVDTNKPIIIVNGGSTSIEATSVYTDAGARVLDELDSLVISPTATVTGANFNTSIVGPHIITYTYTDRAGNQATPVTRTVTVIDTTMPIITIKGSVFVQIQAGTSYTDAGATAKDSADGDLTAAIVVTGIPANTQTPGSYSIVYNVKDKSGVSAIAETRTLLLVDTIAPTITLTGASSITWEAGTTYIDAGATATDAYGISSPAYLQSQMKGSNFVNYMKLGYYSYCYTTKDAAGNVASTVCRNIEVVDHTPPVITLLGVNPFVLEAGATFKDPGATAYDIVDFDVTYKLTTSLALNNVVPGDYILTYSVTDLNGNTGTKTRTVRVVDTTPPVISLLPNGADSAYVVWEGGAAWTYGAVATDIVDASAALTAKIVVTGSVNVMVVGTYILKYDVTDSHNNKAQQVTRTVSVVDTTPPVITLVGPSSVTHEGGSGYMDGIYGYTVSDNVDSSATLKPRIQIVNNVKNRTLGEYTFVYDVKDMQGNAALSVARTIKVIDTTKPVIQLIGASEMTLEATFDGLAYLEQGVVITDLVDQPFPSCECAQGTPACEGDPDVQPPTCRKRLASLYHVSNGPVDSSYPNTVVLNYDVTDLSGNNATTVMRTVHIVDTTPARIWLNGPAFMNITACPFPKTMTKCDFSVEYMAKQSTWSSDRECSTISAPCDIGYGSGGEADYSGEFEAEAPTKTSDRVCQAYTICKSFQEEVVAPTPTSDRECFGTTTTSTTTTTKKATTPKKKRDADGGFTLPPGFTFPGGFTLPSGFTFPSGFSGSGFSGSGSGMMCGDEEYFDEAEKKCVPFTRCDFSKQYVSKMPSPTADLECSDLTTCDSESQYVSVLPTLTSDLECADLTECADSDYEAVAPTWSSDRECKLWQPCLALDYVFHDPGAQAWDIVDHDMTINITRTPIDMYTVSYQDLVYQVIDSSNNKNQTVRTMRVHCANGTYFDADSSTCRICPVGYKCPFGDLQQCSANIPGSLGEYQDTTGQVACKKCPKFTTTGYGSDSITDCICGAGYSRVANLCVDKTIPVLNSCPSQNIVINTEVDQAYGVITETVAPTIISLRITDNCQAFSNDGVFLFDGAVNNDCVSLDNQFVHQFSIGITTLKVFGDDSSKNRVADANACVLNIEVVDNQSPKMYGCPGDVTVNTDAGRSFATVPMNLTFWDNNIAFVNSTGTEMNMCVATADKRGMTCGCVYDGATCNTPSGCRFGVGATDVQFIGRDPVGVAGDPTHVQVCQFTVTVNDVEPPVAICPADIYVHAEKVDIPTTTTTTTSTTMEGSGSGSGSGSNNGGQPARRDAGATPSDCTVFQYFDWDVNECVSLSNLMGGDTEVVWSMPPSRDNVALLPKSFTTDYNSQDQFPLGTTSVHQSVEDRAGHMSSCSFTVTVCPYGLAGKYCNETCLCDSTLCNAATAECQSTLPVVATQCGTLSPKRGEAAAYMVMEISGLEPNFYRYDSNRVDFSYMLYEYFGVPQSNTTVKFHPAGPKQDDLDGLAAVEISFTIIAAEDVILSVADADVESTIRGLLAFDSDAVDVDDILNAVLTRESVACDDGPDSCTQTATYSLEMLSGTTSSFLETKATALIEGNGEHSIDNNVYHSSGLTDPVIKCTSVNVNYGTSPTVTYVQTIEVCGIYNRALGVAFQTKLNGVFQKDCNHIEGGPFLDYIAQVDTNKRPSAVFYRGTRISGSAQAPVTTPCGFGEYSKDGACMTCGCGGVPCNSDGVCQTSLYWVAFNIPVQYTTLFGNPVNPNRVDTTMKDVKTALGKIQGVSIATIDSVRFSMYTKNVTNSTKARRSSEGDVEVVVFSTSNGTVQAIKKASPFTVVLSLLNNKTTSAQVTKVATTANSTAVDSTPEQSTSSASSGSSGGSSLIIAAAAAAAVIIIIAIIVVVVMRKRSKRSAPGAPSSMISFDNPSYRDEDAPGKSQVRGLENPIYQTSTQVVQNPVYDGVGQPEATYETADRPNPHLAVPQESGYLDVNPNEAEIVSPKDSYKQNNELMYDEAN